MVEHITPKRRLIFTGLHGVISQKLKLLNIRAWQSSYLIRLFYGRVNPDHITSDPQTFSPVLNKTGSLERLEMQLIPVKMAQKLAVRIHSIKISGDIEGKVTISSAVFTLLTTVYVALWRLREQQDLQPQSRPC
jgi:hypothetical protein